MEVIVVQLRDELEDVVSSQHDSLGHHPAPQWLAGAMVPHDFILAMQVDAARKSLWNRLASPGRAYTDGTRKCREYKPTFIFS